MSDDRITRSGEGCGTDCLSLHLRAAYLSGPTDDVAAQHLERIFAAADTMPATAPKVIDLTDRRRARRMAVGAIALGAFALSGGLAAAGQLPAPVQARVSSVVAPIGVHVPDGKGPRVVERLPASAIDGEKGKAGEQGKAAQHETPDPTPPGLDGVDPSQSDNAPGRGGTDPGNSGNAPGHGGPIPSTVPSTPPTTAVPDGGKPTDTKKPKDDVTTSTSSPTTTTAKAPGGPNGGNSTTQADNGQGSGTSGAGNQQ